MEFLNRLFRILSEERRRYALYVLDRADGPITIDELADEVRRLESEGEPTRTGGFDDVAVSLAHTHLPAAARAEYVEYDRAADEIRVSGEPAEFELLLTVSEAIERPDSRRLPDVADLTVNDVLSRLSATGYTDD